MTNKRLFSLLKKLDKKELRSFEKFLESPYHNTNTKLVYLFQLIQEATPDNYEGDLVSDDYLFKMLFPNEIKKTSYLSTLSSKLTDLLEEFLIQEMLKKEKIYKNRLLLQTLIERGNLEEFKKTYKQGKLLENKEGIDTTSFHHKYLLGRLYTHFLQLTNNQAYKDYLQSVSDNFDVYYLLNKLRLSWEMMAVSKVIDIDYVFTLLDDILEIIALPQFKDNTLLQLFKQVILFQKYPEQLAYFEAFMKLLRTHNKNMAAREQHELYILAANYCIQKVRNGKEQFRENLFVIYKEMIDKQIVYVSIYLDATRFKNIISLGCRYQEWDWTHDFIQSYSIQLQPEIIEAAKNFAYGSLYFYKGAWHQALDCLRNEIKVDIYFTIDTKVLLLKCYYELKDDYYWILERQIETFRKYITSNKIIPKEQKQNFKNFNACLKKLLQIREQQKLKKLPKSKLIVLKKDIETATPLTDKPWLLDKITELKLS